MVKGIEHKKLMEEIYALSDIARTFFLLNQTSNSIANKYLKKMNVPVIDIAPYVSVIEQCRKYET